MTYKVLIPTAGTGSRLAELSQNLNKSLLAVANKPIISHIIDKFPEEIEFVIALGYKGELVKEFLEIAYPQRKFTYVNVDPYEGKGSGLGLSVYLCREHLQCPFVFCSCDTIVKESIPEPDRNWMAFTSLDRDATKLQVEQYRTLKINNGFVEKILEKGESNSNIFPYIGLAGIHDYKKFWSAMDFESSSQEIILPDNFDKSHIKDLIIKQGESWGLRNLLSNKFQIEALQFTWYDTGIPAELERSRRALAKPNSPNILEKATEAIWFVDDSVIKFSTDTSFISNRVKRAEVIKNFVPNINAASTHMYRYDKAPGKVLSDAVNLSIFQDFLDFSKSFWQSPVIKGELSAAAKGNFKQTCMKFYKDKTISRIEKYYTDFKQKDLCETVNGHQLPSMSEILAKIDWDWLAEGEAGNFHGDYHFENIVYSGNKKFVMLDWRQEFGGVIEYGDIYYDFGKLNHGLIVSHEIINNDHYWVKFNGKDPSEVSIAKITELEVDFDLHRKQILVDCENYFKEWIIAEGYDYKKVEVMTALIYLNIAALHHYPYCHLLYFLGKTMLHNAISKQNNKVLACSKVAN